MLIESPVKVIRSVLANIISAFILESEGLEEKNGFMRHRSFCNGIFAVTLTVMNII